VQGVSGLAAYSRRRIAFPPNRAQTSAPQRIDAECHVWTAPAMQEESDVSAKRSGAAMYPAFECSRYGCWP